MPQQEGVAGLTYTPGNTIVITKRLAESNTIISIGQTDFQQVTCESRVVTGGGFRGSNFIGNGIVVDWNGPMCEDSEGWLVIGTVSADNVWDASIRVHVIRAKIN